MLSRLNKYLEKKWDFRDIVTKVKDTRLFPNIPTSSIFLVTFGMFAMRMRSLNTAEQSLRAPSRWEEYVGKKIPSADDIGYVMARFALDELRDILAVIAHKVKRRKILKWLSKYAYLKPYWVAALDGHELFSSYKRCCDKCLKREVETAKGKKTQYYHKIVMLQMVGVSPALTLDVEPVLPGEDEVAAALRIVKRIRKRYPRFIDILTVDALYLGAPFFKQLRKEGFHVVAVIKQENRDLYKDVEGLIKITEPEIINNGNREIKIWNLNGLTSWGQLETTVRVVCTEEREIKNVRIAGKWETEEIVSNWYWATTLPSDQVKPELIYDCGHARWDIENRGFNDLSTNWGMNHCFHHEPNAIMGFLLVLFIAYVLTTIFFTRNLKPAFRKGKTKIFLALLLLCDLMNLQGKPFWSQAQPP